MREEGTGRSDCEAVGGGAPQDLQCLEPAESDWVRTAYRRRTHQVSEGIRVEKEIREWIAERPDLTLKELCKRLKDPFSIILSISALSRQLLENQPIFLSSALHGWNVGLKPLADRSLEVYFAKLLLGHLHPDTASFTPILPTEPTNNEEAAA
jgi:hypothetical protein